MRTGPSRKGKTKQSTKPSRRGKPSITETNEKKHPTLPYCTPYGGKDWETNKDKRGALLRITLIGFRNGKEHDRFTSVIHRGRPSLSGTIGVQCKEHKPRLNVSKIKMKRTYKKLFLNRGKKQNRRDPRMPSEFMTPRNPRKRKVQKRKTRISGLRNREETNGGRRQWQPKNQMASGEIVAEVLKKRRGSLMVTGKGGNIKHNQRKRH